MDHTEAVGQNATEKYLLNELDPEVRDQFEEHLFGCTDCALDVRAAAMFVEQSKVVLAETPAAAAVRIPVPVPAQQGWLGQRRYEWLRPAFAVPVLALLLITVGYQNLVTMPHLEQAANRPHLLPAASINLLTYGANPSPLALHAGEGFLLNVIVPPGAQYSSYRADLHNPAGGVELSLSIPASAEDTWPIQVPGANRESGIYKLTVTGVTAEGKEVEVGRGSLALQIQK